MYVGEMSYLSSIVAVVGDGRIGWYNTRAYRYPNVCDTLHLVTVAINARCLATGPEYPTIVSDFSVVKIRSNFKLSIC